MEVKNLKQEKDKDQKEEIVIETMADDLRKAREKKVLAPKGKESVQSKTKVPKRKRVEKKEVEDIKKKQTPEIAEKKNSPRTKSWLIGIGVVLIIFSLAALAYYYWFVFGTGGTNILPGVGSLPFSHPVQLPSVPSKPSSQSSSTASSIATTTFPAAFKTEGILTIQTDILSLQEMKTQVADLPLKNLAPGNIYQLRILYKGHWLTLQDIKDMDLQVCPVCSNQELTALIRPQSLQFFLFVAQGGKIIPAITANIKQGYEQIFNKRLREEENQLSNSFYNISGELSEVDYATSSKRFATSTISAANIFHRFISLPGGTSIDYLTTPEGIFVITFSKQAALSIENRLQNLHKF